ncbi:MAG: ABC transporter ATP-binding protein [Peptostreptococcaceae bacterium]
MSTLLKIENLTKNFGDTKILEKIDLTINKGEIISVLGPSGCGKSTLLRIICGILDLDDGEIYIEGELVYSKKKNIPTEKRDINMVFQDFALWPHMKVIDNILYGLKIKKISKDEINNRLKELLELLKLEGLMNRYPKELSGGQRQRVAIARALITKPKIILLDEPLCNLDIQLRIEMRTEMAYLFKKLETTVFHVTHDPSEAFAMADRIIIMNNGKIDQIDTPINCYNSPNTITVAGLLGANNSLNGNIIKTYDDYALINICGNTFKTKSFFDNAKVNDEVIVNFRPEYAKLSQKLNMNTLFIKVVISTFEGNYYRIYAELENKEKLSFLNETCLEINSTYYIKIDSNNLFSYEKNN